MSTNQNGAPSGCAPNGVTRLDPAEQGLQTTWCPLRCRVFGIFVEYFLAQARPRTPPLSFRLLGTAEFVCRLLPRIARRRLFAIPPCPIIKELGEPDPSSCRDAIHCGRRLGELVNSHSSNKHGILFLATAALLWLLIDKCHAASLPVIIIITVRIFVKASADPLFPRQEEGAV